MTRSLNIALLGYGAVAGYVAEHADSLEGVKVLAVICRETSTDKARLFARERYPVVTSVAQLTQQPQLLVDCAGHSGLKSHAPAALSNGIDVISISTGALADMAICEELDACAMAGNSNIRFLSGAVGGVDALMSASAGVIDSVTYRGRKPPAAWSGSPAEHQCDLASLNAPFLHFSGTARGAAKLYPKNANVAATIALASVGLDNVRVQLIADPTVSQNVHEIEASGEFGKLRLTIEGNSLADNPKTSALAAMSIVSELKRRTSHIQI